MKKTGFLLFIVFVLFSCGQYKRFTYIQPSQANMKDSIFNKVFTPYKLQPADILRVNIISLDKNVTEMFNNDVATSNSSSSGASGGSYYLLGHSIDKEGYISLPVLGRVMMAGLTVDEATALIQKLAEEYIKDARAEVKLLSFKIYFLGEVGGAGMQTVFSDRANILEVISMAGGVTYNGNRKKITILRSYLNYTKVIEVDLTRRDLLSSAQYYLQPNDIVYVEPLKTTTFRMRLSEYSGIMSLITSMVAMVVLITNTNK